MTEQLLDSVKSKYSAVAGRNSHSSFMPDGARVLQMNEIAMIVESFGEAARNAMSAGFDGVELQASNSHLIDQFLEDGTNLRTDQYGATITNRLRFLMEIVELVSASIGSDRLGVRLSPFGEYGGITSAAFQRTYATRKSCGSESRLEYSYANLSIVSLKLANLR